MELPEDIVRTIKDFSMPITHPHWRTLHKMTAVDFNMAIARELCFTCPRVIAMFINNCTSENYIYNIQFDSRRGCYINCMYKKHTWERILICAFTKKT